MSSINFTTEDIKQLLDGEDSSLYMLYTTAGTATIMTAFILQSAVITTFSLIVLIAIFHDKSMRVLPQFLCIGNLAFCDLLVGCFISPLNIPFILYQERAWNYGANLCKAWLVVDNVVTCEIPISVTLIVYDRYLWATYGIAYFREETLSKCCIRIFCSWLWCFLLYGPVITLWDIVQGYSKIPEHECDEEFSMFPLVDATLTFVEMLVPLTLICFYGIKLALIYNGKKSACKEIPNVCAICQRYFPVYESSSILNISRGKKLEKKIKQEKNLFVGVGVFLLFWSPYILTFSVKAIMSQTAGILGESVYWFNVGGTVIHPFLFALEKRRFAIKLGQTFKSIRLRGTALLYLRNDVEKKSSKSRVSVQLLKRTAKIDGL